jgi:cytochrome c biogenesis protein CcmG, thiol:disulfide interchange protein DsbE
MGNKLSPPQVLGIAALAIFTLFITWRAKSLEKRLHERNEASALVGKKAADFSLPALDGQVVTLADFRNKKKVVVSFWASWCGPCRLELPVLADFYKEHHKDSSDFEILAISIDDDRAAAQAYATNAKLPFPVLLDPDSKAAGAYSVEAIPSMFVIDSNGTVVEGDTGMDMAMDVRLAMRLGIDLNPKKPGAADDDASH